MTGSRLREESAAKDKEAEEAKVAANAAADVAKKNEKELKIEEKAANKQVKETTAARVTAEKKAATLSTSTAAALEKTLHGQVGRSS